MNANDMLDYALGQTEGPTRDQFERELAADPALAARQGRLDRAVRALLDDGEPSAYDPPEGLVKGTLGLVQESARKRRSLLDFVPRRVPFRAADVAVAAGVLIAGVLTLLPAVHRTRDQMNQAGCTANLKDLGRALWLYGSRHDHFPFGPEFDPGAHAGSYAVALYDDQLLNDRRLLDCPCNGHCQAHGPLPRLTELPALRDSDWDAYREAHCTDYAYNVSFTNGSGRTEPIAALVGGVIPILADKPGHEGDALILPGNSPNHRGRGQNVLYTDLHVRWHVTRSVGPDDDIFLNTKQEPAPGTHSRDFVLCPPLVPCLIAPAR